MQQPPRGGHEAGRAPGRGLLMLKKDSQSGMSLGKGRSLRL